MGLNLCNQPIQVLPDKETCIVKNGLQGVCIRQVDPCWVLCHHRGNGIDHLDDRLFPRCSGPSQRINRIINNG